jgi:hypothetical protein
MRQCVIVKAACLSSGDVAVGGDVDWAERPIEIFDVESIHCYKAGITPLTVYLL